jgi:hypothetical protein
MPAATAPSLAAGAAQAVADNRIDRISSVSARDTLERIRDSGVLKTGAVNMIGLDAIRRQLGDRWSAKKGRVWEHVEQEFQRKLGPADLAVRIDDINYLVAAPSAPGFAAQALCLSILQEVLKFFLGEIRTGDITVRVVTDVAEGAIVSAPVDLARLAQARAASRPSPGKPASEELSDQSSPPADWRPPLAGRTSVVELALPKQEPFDIRLTVEPVWNLRRGLIMSFVIGRAGVPLGANAAELEAVDMATFAYAATLLEESADQGGPLTLHVPISFSSLAVQHARLRLLRLTQSVREAMRASMLLELCGLDAGVPPSRLLETAGLVRSLVAGVVGRVRPSKPALAAVKACGLRGLAVEAPLLGLNQPDAPARMKAFVVAAQTVSPNLIIHGLPAPTAVDAAAVAGFTHASVASPPPPSAT